MISTHHPTGTHHVVVVVNCPASSRQRPVCTTVQSHTGQCSYWPANFAHFKIKKIWRFFSPNRKIFGEQMEWLFIRPCVKFQRIWCQKISKSHCKVKNEVEDKFRYLFLASLPGWFSQETFYPSAMISGWILVVVCGGLDSATRSCELPSWVDGGDKGKDLTNQLGNLP